MRQIDGVTVLDPTASWSVPRTRLAHRDASLDGRRILLFDNGKLHPSFGGYAAVFEVLGTALETEHAVVERDSGNLLDHTVADLKTLADEVAGRGCDAVVLALCDTGVTMPTIILATELEARGVATSVVCQGIGYLTARAVLGRLLPGVPLVELSTDRTAPAERVRAEMLAGAAGAVVSGLRATGPELLERFGAVADGYRPAGRAEAHLELPADDPIAFTEQMGERGIGDGLLLTPPTLARVDAMLAAMGRPAGAEVWPALVPRGSAVTVADVAIVAVMAGCAPALGRLVLTAYEAMADERFRLFQAAITTHPSGTLVLVSGPESERAGLASGFGSMGPGNPANAALGRAVALAYNVVLGVRPGMGDLSLQGSPAEYSFCVAEDIPRNPWHGYHRLFGSPSDTAVLVLKCEGPHNVMDNVNTSALGVLNTVAAALHGPGKNNCYNPAAQTVVFLSPEHANIIAADGWALDDVRSYLFEKARSRREDLLSSGITPSWPTWFWALERVPIVTDPADIVVVVTGAAGPQSQVALPWGYSRGAVRLVRA